MLLRALLADAVGAAGLKSESADGRGLKNGRSAHLSRDADAGTVASRPKQSMKSS